MRNIRKKAWPTKSEASDTNRAIQCICSISGWFRYWQPMLNEALFCFLFRDTNEQCVIWKCDSCWTSVEKLCILMNKKKTIIRFKIIESFINFDWLKRKSHTQNKKKSSNFDRSMKAHFSYTMRFVIACTHTQSFQCDCRCEWLQLR